MNKASGKRLPLLVATTIGGALAASTAPARAQDVDPAALFVQAQYACGLFPQAVAVADLDGDGVPDVAVANQFGSTVSVLFGAGGEAGGFLPQVQVGTGSQPRSLLAADLDGDGRPELVTADAGSASVTVLWNLGGGAFGAALYPAGASPRDVAAGDLDGDGRLDLVVARDSTATPLSRLMNLGPAGFSSPAAMGSGFRANAVRLADLDGDGAQDLVVADPTTERVLTRRGLGDGSFAAVVGWPVHVDPLGLAVADLDGDGDLDVVSSSTAAGSLAVLRGGGDGTFAPAELLPLPPAPQSVDAGDVDGDGAPDLVASHLNSSTVSVLLSDGAGSWGAPLALSAAMLPGRVTVADASGDGVPDVVVPNQFSNTVSVFVSQVAPDPWTDLGGGVAGHLGSAVLLGEGEPVPGGVVTLTVTADATQGPPAVLVVGASEQSVPYHGGLLVPTEDLAFALPLDTPTDFAWPADMPPGTALYFQAWFQAPGANGKGQGQGQGNGKGQDKGKGPGQGQGQGPTGLTTGSNALRAVTQAP